MVLFQVEEVENVSMPRFYINREGSFTLSTALIYVSRGVIEHAQHRNNAVAGTVGASDVRTCSPNVVDR